MGTINVAKRCGFTGVKRLVQLAHGYFMIAGWRATVPSRRISIAGPGEPYGNSKVAKELMVEAYQRLYGI